MPGDDVRPRHVGQATCRYKHCPHEDCITPPLSFRASIEKREQCTTPGKEVGYAPLKSLSETRRTKKGPNGDYGRGANGEEWWCLSCLEALFDGREPLPVTKTTNPDRPEQWLAVISRFMIPEIRLVLNRPFSYALDIPLIYTVYKWKGVLLAFYSRWNGNTIPWEGPEDAAGAGWGAFPGHDGVTLHNSIAGLNATGVLPDGQKVELPAADAKWTVLSTCLNWAQLQHAKAKRAAREAAARAALPVQPVNASAPARNPRNSRGVPIVRATTPTPERELGPPNTANEQPRAPGTPSVARAPRPNSSAVQARVPPNVHSVLTVRATQPTHLDAGDAGNSGGEPAVVAGKKRKQSDTEGDGEDGQPTKIAKPTKEGDKAGTS